MNRPTKEAYGWKDPAQYDQGGWVEGSNFDAYFEAVGIWEAWRDLSPIEKELQTMDAGPEFKDGARWAIGKLMQP